MIILPTLQSVAKIGLLVFVLLVMFVGERASAQTPFPVVRGEPMPSLYWRVAGLPSCDTTFGVTNTPPASPFEYPPASGSIRSLWLGSTPSTIGGNNFGGQPALGDPNRGFPQSYRFVCTSPDGLTSDTAILTINDCPLPTTWSTTLQACSSDIPRLLVCPLTTTSVLQGSQISFQLRHWTHRPTPPDCSNLDHTSVPTNAGVWSSAAPVIASIVAPGVVQGDGIGGTTISATYAGLTAAVDVTVNPVPVPVGVFNFTNCSVPIGSFNCPATVGWDTSDVTAVSVTGPSAFSSPALDNPGVPFVLGPGTYTYHMLNLTPGPLFGRSFHSDSMTIDCALGSTPDPVTGRCTGQPDLTPNVTITHIAGTLEQDQVVRFRSQVINVGNDQTLTGFETNFSYRWNGGSWTDLPATPHGPLNAASTHGVDDSPALTLDRTGTLTMQYCVDSNRVVTEANEGNNCITLDVNVLLPVPDAPPAFTARPGSCGGIIELDWQDTPYAASYEVSRDGGSNWISTGSDTDHRFTGLAADRLYPDLQVRARNTSGASTPARASARSSVACNALSGSGCTIPDGDSRCDGRVTWDLTGQLIPNIYNLTRSSVVYTGIAVGSSQPIELIYGTNVIQGRDDTAVRSSIDLTASCLPDSFYHLGFGTCQSRPEITITADPVWIRSGATASIAVSITANYDLACTFPPSTGLSPINHRASPAPQAYPSDETPPLISAQVIQVSCAAPGLTPVASNEVKINVLPTVEER